MDIPLLEKNISRLYTLFGLALKDSALHESLCRSIRAGAMEPLYQLDPPADVVALFEEIEAAAARENLAAAMVAIDELFPET